MTKQEAIQDQIDQIMDEFDFEAIHKWMKHSKWTWGSSRGEVPEIYELRKAARKRLKEASVGFGSSSGGFSARMREGVDDIDGKPFVHLSLSFGYNTCNDGTSYDEKTA